MTNLPNPFEGINEQKKAEETKKENNRFKLDVEKFMLDIEPPPLFLQNVKYGT